MRDDWERQIAVIGSGGIPQAPDLFAGYIHRDEGHPPPLFAGRRGRDRGPAGRRRSRRLPVGAAGGRAGGVADPERRNAAENRRADDAVGRPSASGWPPTPTAAGESRGEHALSAGALGNPPVYAGRLDEMAEDLKTRLAAGWRVTVATDQVDRVSELLEERGLYPRRERGKRAMRPAPLPAGTIEVQPSGPRRRLDVGKAARPAYWTAWSCSVSASAPGGVTKRSMAEHRAFAQNLVEGEHVVHIDHGIAKFSGLVRMETGGVERDYLLLVFDRGDKLYVPIDQSDRVTRYSGGGRARP